MADDVKLCVVNKPPPPLDTTVEASLVRRHQPSSLPLHCFHLSTIQQGNSEFIQPITADPLSRQVSSSPLTSSINDSNNCGSISPTSTNNTGEFQVLDPDKIMRRVLNSIFRELKSCSLSNLEYFRNGKQSYHARLQVAFSLLCEHIDKGIEPQLGILLPCLANYDISPEIPANGYRSLLMVIQKCCLHLLQLSRHIMINRNCVLFRIVHYTRELEAYVTVLGQLRACLYFSCELMNYCPKDSLFVDTDIIEHPVAFRLLKEFDSLSQDCFYGRCLGFQFCESMRKPLLCVVVALASFSEGYNETSNFMKFAYSVLSTGKYLLDPELRARQVVHVARSADIQFCKSFWSLLETDIPSRLSLLSGYVLQVNSVLKIEPVPIELPKIDSKGKETVCIEVPSIYSGSTKLQFRLLSFDLLQGQEILLKDHLIIRLPNKSQPPSSTLLFHIHGGGFVAQSSKSHEVYLRQWAHELKVPIVSVDYSLAPENPFPRALEECFYFYAWVLNNPEQVGWTGERICFAGDSAGGNLVLAVTLRAIDCNIRIPDGILPVYTSAVISIVPSPSRLLSVMDPLLPVGIILKCLDAYIGTSSVSSDYGKPAVEEDSQDNSPEKENQEQEEETEDSSGTDTTPTFLPCNNHETIDLQNIKGFSSDLNEFFSPEGSDDDDEDIDEKPSCLLEQFLPRTPEPNTNNFSERDLPFSSASSPGHVPYLDGQIPRSISTPVFNRTEKIHLQPPHLSSFDSSNVDSAMERFIKLTINKNPLVSPVYATEKQLLMFPEVSFVTCHLDPLLDDSVTLCKRLRQLGKVTDFTVLDDLPHGFLNFALVSKDARQGSNVCVAKLRKLLHLV